MGALTAAHAECALAAPTTVTALTAQVTVRAVIAVSAEVAATAAGALPTTHVGAVGNAATGVGCSIAILPSQFEECNESLI